MTVDVAYKRVGDVLKLERRVIPIEPTNSYELIGVYSFGKGIFHRGPTIGADLGPYRFSRIREGDLVLSNIQAWEGAIALASAQDDGCIGTHRFLTYVPVDGVVDTNYLRYFFLSEQGIELIRRASPGTIVRNRTLGIRAFEALEIPVPPIEVQRERVDRLEAVIRRVRDCSSRAFRASQQRSSIADAMIQRHFGLGAARKWPLRRLGDVAEVSPTPARLEPDTSISFVPMRAVDSVTGRIVGPEVRGVGDLKSGYRQFRKGDVIFARITPCMQNGKTAVASGLPTEYGFGSTEFHVIRPGEMVIAAWLHQIFRTTAFKGDAAKHFTGTAGQQRVPARFLREVMIPVPSIVEQQSAVERIEMTAGKGRRLAELHAARRARLNALEASVLNETVCSRT